MGNSSCPFFGAMNRFRSGMGERTLLPFFSFFFFFVHRVSRAFGAGERTLFLFFFLGMEDAEHRYQIADPWTRGRVPAGNFLSICEK